MKIKIGVVIKSLRIKADVTQEKFAEYLGITPQAVSRWENETAYPDIEIIPSIANFFNVSADILLGLDQSKNLAKIEIIYEQLREYHAKGKAEKSYELLRNAVHEFPNHSGFLSELAYTLEDMAEKLSSEERKNYYNESISIRERILADCLDDGARTGILAGLAYAYDSIGNKEKAIETAKRLSTIWNSVNVVLCNILKGEEKCKLLADTAVQLTDILSMEYMQLARDKYKDRNDADSVNKRILLYKKAIACYDILFENQDYGFYNCRMSEFYMYLAETYILLADTANTLDCLEKAVLFALAADTPPLDFQHTSVVFEFEKEPDEKSKKSSGGTKKGYDYNETYRLLNNELPKSCYNMVRDNMRFKAIEAELKKYAKKED